MIKIKLTRTEVIELHQLCGYFKGTFRHYDGHRLLLAGHIQQLHDLLYRKLCDAGLKNFTLKLDPVQALAFHQFWEMTDTSLFPLGTVVVAKCVQAIDKVVKNSRVYV